jgi:hypothetical protein
MHMAELDYASPFTILVSLPTTSHSQRCFVVLLRRLVDHDCDGARRLVEHSTTNSRRKKRAVLELRNCLKKKSNEEWFFRKQSLFPASRVDVDPPFLVVGICSVRRLAG